MRDRSSDIQKFMVENRLTLSLAESCTGGLLAHLITKNPGASKYFMGSLVVYANKLKEQLLDVQHETLAKEGAVSESVVKEMLQGLLKTCDTSFGIAVSGVAGPEGSRPVGTVWYSVGSQKNHVTGCLHLSGKREEIIQQASYQLLDILYEQLLQAR